MYGWRGSIGHVSPSILDTQRYEFDKLMPEGVMVVSTTLKVQNLVEKELEMGFSQMEEEALRLVREGVGAIVIGGGPIFSFKGVESHKSIIDSVYDKTGVPTSTGVAAAMDAFRSRGVKRLVVVTPWVSERNEAHRRFLDSSGFEVLSIKGLGLSRNADMARAPFHASYLLAVEAFREAKGVEGVYIACPRWPVVSNIDSLEKDLGVFVVSDIQAMTWFGLKSLGINEVIKGYGNLLESKK